MNPREARTVLRGHKTGAQLDGPLQKALRVAESDPALKREFEQQAELDGWMVAVIHTLPLPGGLLEKMTKLEAAPAKRGLDWRGAVKNPTVISGVIALLVMLGSLVYFWMDRLNNFPGRDSLFRMISTTQDMSGAELDPLVTDAGKVGDWFLLKYGLEDFDVPPEFATMKTVGGRMFQLDNNPVAQIAVERDKGAGPFPGSGLLFFIFRAADFGVKLPAADRWFVLKQDDWVAAVHGEDKTCFMVAAKGTKEEMEDFLKQLPAK